MRIVLFIFACRLCAAEVTVVGGRRRRFCDNCRRLLAVRMRRAKRERFVRRLADGRRAA